MNKLRNLSPDPALRRAQIYIFHLQCERDQLKRELGRAHGPVGDGTLKTVHGAALNAV